MQHDHSQMQTVSGTGYWLPDFFTGGGNYMPRTHCMITAEGSTDWPWVAIIITITAIIITGYARIFLFWRKAYLAEQPQDRNDKLMDLAWIFLWCAVCGYLSSITTFFWPAYRLLALALLPLAFFTWRFARDLSGFRLALQAKRLERELRESLEARNEELERLVAERTAQAEAAQAEAERANRAKSDFLANMSHEIRTPMNAILGFTDLLADPESTDQDRAEHSAIVERNGRHLLALIDDVLDLSKIEAGEVSMEWFACDPARIGADAVELLRNRASERGNTIALHIGEGVPRRIAADPTRLRQILVNLIGNAVKFTEYGEINVTIDRADDHVRFHVADTGIGLSEEQARLVFDPFSQADETTTRKYGGTGLGLSISCQLARAMGGEISVASEIGMGSTFTASVAVGAPEGLGDFHTADDTPRTAVAGGSLPCRVLLAEDTKDNQTLFVYFFERVGATVTLAQNGREALDAFENARQDGNPFDLIVMDMQMPEFSGEAATAELRSRGAKTPILALTACAMPGDRERCLEIGCDAYLAKPVKAETLIDTGRSLVEGAGRAAA